MREGFIKGDYAAIPYGKKQLVIIYNGQQLDVVNTPLQAQKFIKNHQASQSTAKLPIN
jgi:hypothetical protein